MTSYDDDLPTEHEEILLKQLVDNGEEEQRIRAIIEVLNIFYLSIFKKKRRIYCHHVGCCIALGFLFL